MVADTVFFPKGICQFKGMSLGSGLDFAEELYWRKEKSEISVTDWNLRSSMYVAHFPRGTFTEF